MPELALFGKRQIEDLFVTHGQSRPFGRPAQRILPRISILISTHVDNWTKIDMRPVDSVFDDALGLWKMCITGTAQLPNSCHILRRKEPIRPIVLLSVLRVWRCCMTYLIDHGPVHSALLDGLHSRMTCVTSVPFSVLLALCMLISRRSVTAYGCPRTIPSPVSDRTSLGLHCREQTSCDRGRHRRSADSICRSGEHRLHQS